MHERCELQPPFPARRLTYAFQARRRTTNPAPSPGCRNLFRVPLAALLPSTISAGLSPLFDGFPGTTSASDLSTTGGSGVWLLAFPELPDVVAPGAVEISQLLCRKLPGVYRVSDRAGPSQDSRVSPWSVLPSALLNGVGVPDL